MKSEDLAEMLDTTAAELTEHFDAVQILASLTDESGTRFFKKGKGNWFARTGMAQEFLQVANAEIEAEELSDRLRNEDE